LAVTPGTRLGVYEILSALGAGGMGEVYRAKDTKLGRDVALKILPDTFTHDPERLIRFRREAQVLASLNHPNIGAIYGLEEIDGSGAARFRSMKRSPSRSRSQRRSKRRTRKGSSIAI
jgi:serine/threonine protein kinase